jgi:transposase
VTDAATRLAELEAALAAERATVAVLRAERDHLAADRDALRLAYQNLQLELALLKRRLFVAKAERIDTTQLELELGDKLVALDALNRQLGIDIHALDGDDDESDGPGARGNGARRPPTGRRDLRDLDLPEERLEIPSPSPDGAAQIGWEESRRLYWRRASWVRLVVARPIYKLAPPPDAPPDTAPTLLTAPMPPTIPARSIATPSLLAHVAVDKFCDGLPLHRQEDRFARLGCRVDRGTMSRWLEEIGATCGATVVEAMRAEALRSAFCIATDATGVLVQPIRGGDQPRRGCTRGHFFVQIADADHVFFEYTPRETSAAVGAMFTGFAGYVLADAKSVYDVLFRPTGRPPPDGDAEPARHEVGCWSHARRKFWEAAVITADPVAREGLLRVGRVFDLDRRWKKASAAERKAARDLHVRPHLDAFFAWVADEYARVRDQRGLLRSALGYAQNQRAALTRFLDDGRLPLTNNQSERELRRVAVGRKAWLFVGSDDHAQAAGHLLTLIASARLHQLDPEAYLRDLLRVLPHWPRDRYLELAPRYWSATRARLDLRQLELEIGWLDVPPPPSSQQPATR